MLHKTSSSTVCKMKGKEEVMEIRRLSVQFNSVTQSCPAHWDPMNYSTPGFPVHHRLLEIASCPSGWWCYPTISSSEVPFSSCLQSCPASGSSPMSQFFPSGGQSIGVSASASVLLLLFSISVLSSAYLRLWIFLLVILIPDCSSLSPAFQMTYSAYKLSKQGDNIQPWHTPFPIWNQSVVPCLVLTVASWPAYRFLRRQVRWSGIPISWRIFQLVVIHTKALA